MEPIEVLGPNKKVVRFMSDYMLKGVINLNDDERKAYLRFIELMTIERFVVDESKINLNDLTHAHKPGAIVRRKT